MKITIELDENDTGDLVKAREVIDSLLSRDLGGRDNGHTRVYSIHPVQEAILDLARNQDIGQLTLRAIGERINKPHPQVIKYHLEQLKRKGLLMIKRKGGD